MAIAPPSPAPVEPLALRAHERLPAAVLLSWAPPILALSATLFVLQFFFLKYATDVLMLEPLAVGVIFAAGRAWDALSDPIVGTWSDRTRTTLGRRRPWMLAAIVPLLLSLFMIWSPPAWSGIAVYGWIVLALFAYYTAFTMYMVPHQALGAELSTDHHDRSRIFGTQSAAFTLGMLLAFPAMQYVTNAEVPREAASGLVWWSAPLLVAVLMIPPLRVRERPEYVGRGAATSMGAVRDVLRNPHARLLLLAQFVQMFGAGTLGITAPYLVQYVIKRPDLIAALPAIFVLFNVAAIPLWVLASRRWGKRNVWVLAMVGTGIFFGMVSFVREGALVLMGVLLVGAGSCAACGAAMGPSILADVIDSDEHLTRERKEGAYSAAWGFAVKAANTIVILFVSAALQFSDFRPNAEQGPGTLLMLRLLAGAMPFVMFCAGAWILSRLQLTAEAHAAIRADLDARSGDEDGS